MFIIVLAAVMLGGCITVGQRVVQDPESAVRSVLPPGWTILKTETGTYPFYGPKGNGTAFFLGLPRQKYLKAQYSAVLYIMPPDYDDGGPHPTAGQAQTWPPRRIASVSNAKVYLWPGPEVKNWKTMERDLLRALLK